MVNGSANISTVEGGSVVIVDVCWSVTAGQGGRSEDDHAGQHPADAGQRGATGSNQPKRRELERAGEGVREPVCCSPEAHAVQGDQGIFDVHGSSVGGVVDYSRVIVLAVDDAVC